ncbi:hypothetical protein [Streptomyces adustus]|uniref:hypothetical protein n=1 Tax=Streptomyces adustus TaxID=1609272 RepID=UPI00192E5AFE|nr:hypothetical protein [Streptomyces adustus]
MRLRLRLRHCMTTEVRARELWVVDGTQMPVHDQRRSAKNKNYRRSVNVQIVCRARDRRVVAVDEAWPDNRNGSAAEQMAASSKTGTTAGSANARPSQNTSSPDSRTT